MADKSNAGDDATDIKRAADYRDIYANQTLLSWTGTDVQIVLGTISYIGTKQFTDQHATLFLSPGQAKFLALGLAQVVEAMELESGTKVVVPPQMLEWLNSWKRREA